jgi:hypothetical protein
METVPYRNAVGSLLFVAMGTRPDIANAVREVGRFVSNPRWPHWLAVQRIFRYLQGTKDLGLHYRRHEEQLQLVGYADSDWANNVDSRRSITGYLFGLSPGDGAVTWKSKTQTSVALSTCEAEYMALCEAGREAVHLRYLLKDLGVSTANPTTIYEDNTGCIDLANNPCNHQNQAYRRSIPLHS